MMRKIFLAIALVCLAVSAHATINVSGSVVLPSGAAAASNTWVRFDLVNCGVNVPRTIGTGTLANPNGPALAYKTKDFTPNGSGAISGTLYSNAEISCGGTGNSLWRVTIYYNGKADVSTTYSITSNFNLNSPPSPAIAPNPPGNPFHTFSFRGAWDSGTSYKSYDVVTYGGSSFVALVDNSATTPVDGATWSLMSQKGDTGAAGSTGPQGPQGIPGPAGTLAPGSYLQSQLSSIPSPTDGLIADVTDSQRGFYRFKTNWWYPVSADINVRDFGARGDGGWYSAMKCTSGSAIIQGATQNLTNAASVPKVGQTFVVAGCGAAGADLTCTLSAVNTGNSVTCGGGVTAAATTGFTQGGRWGYSVDDTAAFQAAVDFCQTNGSNGGCRIRIPPGTYFITTINIPATTGVQNVGQIQFAGAGQYSSVLVGIGADQSNMISGPANSQSIGLESLGGMSYDYLNKKSRLLYVLGGQRHYVYNVYTNSVYQSVFFSNTWINWISNNYFYSNGDKCIAFDPLTGPVNYTTVANNEISGCTWAVYNNSGVGHGFSEGNLYDHNDCEGTQTNGCYYHEAEWYSNWENGRNEVDGGSTDGTWRNFYLKNVQFSTFKGNNMGCASGRNAASCVEEAALTQGNLFIYNPIATGGSTSAIIAGGGYNYYLGYPNTRSGTTGFSGSNATTQCMFGSANFVIDCNTLVLGAISSYDSRGMHGGGIQFFSPSGGTNVGVGSTGHELGNDPRIPRVDNGGVAQLGDVIFNARYGTGRNQFAGWVNRVASNTYTSGTTSWSGSGQNMGWDLIATSKCKIVDGTAVGTYGQPCDFIRNTSTTTANTVLGWRCINAAGCTTAADWEVVPFPGVTPDANSGNMTAGMLSELITLSTSGSTTDSSANLLPANSVIEGVTCRVTTTITTATDWAIGDATTAARFCSANSTLTANTTSVCLNHRKGGVSTDATGPTQASAAKLRITTTGTPGAGAIRCTVYYRSFTAPTS